MAVYEFERTRVFVYPSLSDPFKVYYAIEAKGSDRKEYGAWTDDVTPDKVQHQVLQFEALEPRTKTPEKTPRKIVRRVTH